MSQYLIEFRFSGYAKQYLKELILDVAKKFHVRGAVQNRAVPHITLVGPLYTPDERRLVKEVKNIVSKYDLVGFKLNGFGHFGNWLMGRRVIFAKIEPSDELKKLRIDLATKLQKFCTLREFDHKKEFHFHATIAFKDINRKHSDIWKYIEDQKIPEMNQFLLRVTIIKNQRILSEYDLMQKRLLYRRAAKSREIFQKTLEILKIRQEPLPTETREILESDQEKVKGRLFLISDLHFNHKNIIRYCKRPFKTEKEMNDRLVKNWNSVVKKSDTVYYLGDITLDENRIDYWLSKLNGKIFFIRGNHDKGKVTKAKEISEPFPLVYKNQKFLLMHEPHRPIDWNGWIIHGDKHNNDLTNFPLIRKENKTINVCAELTDYTPISLDKIISKLK